MTDVMDAIIEAPEGWRLCKECGIPFDPPHTATLYCDVHSTVEAAARRKQRQRDAAKKAGQTDKAPGSVNVNVNMPGPSKGTKKDAEIAQVREWAKRVAVVIAMLVAASGHRDDAHDIVNGSEAWGAAVGQLAMYEDWLRRIAAGGEAGDRAMAWLTLAFATGVMVLPILVRHQVVPEQLAAMAAMMTDTPSAGV